MRSHLSVVDHDSWANWDLVRKYFPKSMSCKVLPMVSPSTFSVSGFTLRYLISLELIFLCVCRVINSGLITFSYIWTSSFASIICYRCCVVFTCTYNLPHCSCVAVVMFTDAWLFCFLPLIYMIALC